MEEDYLQLSGIQHYSFCKRQWALIHIEQQWEENARTMEGKIVHERVHDDSQKDLRKGTLTIRNLHVVSHTLHISGDCDAVEFKKDANGISLAGHQGKWSVYPIEYKRGTPKKNHCDELQVCAEALCLEEMLLCSIPEGAIFYHETQHREKVVFTDELRQETKKCYQEMFELFKKGYTPKIHRTKSCNACSLKNICLPEMEKTESVRDFLRAAMED